MCSGGTPTLASLGVPPLHILRAHNGQEYRFYELSGDLPEALHFRHFEATDPGTPLESGPRIRLGGEVPWTEVASGDTSGRVVLRG